LPSPWLAPAFAILVLAPINGFTYSTGDRDNRGNTGDGDTPDDCDTPDDRGWPTPEKPLINREQIGAMKDILIFIKKTIILKSYLQTKIQYALRQIRITRRIARHLRIGLVFLADIGPGDQVIGAHIYTPVIKL
jgi:hypothetical protein